MSEEVINNSVMCDFIKRIAVQEGFTTYTVDATSATKNGDGFSGAMIQICLDGTKTNEKRTLKCILKKSMTNVSVREKGDLDQMYAREIYMYGTVYPKFLELQTERKIKSPFVGYPKCYGICSVSRNESLLLEDLKESGFRMWPNCALLDVPHAVLVLKTYARFHALSFAMKSLRPQAWEEMTSKMSDVYVRSFKKLEFIGQVVGQIKKVATWFAEQNESDAFSALCRIRENFEEIFYRSLMGGSKDTFVIAHSDCWYNNMMFKYDNKNEPQIPTDMRLLDFQTARIGSPATDLSYFIYSCTTKEVYTDLDHYLHIYHDTMCEFLTELGCRSDIYPFDGLKKDWDDCHLYGFGISYIALLFELSSRENARTLSDIGATNDICADFIGQLDPVDEYYVRILDITKYLIKNKQI